MSRLSEEARMIAALAATLEGDALRELAVTACRLAGKAVPMTFTEEESISTWPDGRLGSARKLAFLQRQLDALRPRLRQAKENARAVVLELARLPVIGAEPARRAAWHLSYLAGELDDVEGLETRLREADRDVRAPADVITLAERLAKRAAGPSRIERLRAVIDHLTDDGDDDPPRPPTG